MNYEVITNTDENKNGVSKEKIMVSHAMGEKEKQTETSINTTLTAPITLNASNPYKLIFTTSTAMYLIKGGVDKVMSKLSVTLEISNDLSDTATSSVHNKRRFKLDLYENKQVEKTIREASEYLQLNKSTLEKDIHDLTEELDRYREQEMQSHNTEADSEPSVYILTSNEYFQSEILKFNLV